MVAGWLIVGIVVLAGVLVIVSGVTLHPRLGLRLGSRLGFLAGSEVVLVIEVVVVMLEFALNAVGELIMACTTALAASDARGVAIEVVVADGIDTGVGWSRMNRCMRLVMRLVLSMRAQNCFQTFLS